MCAVRGENRVNNRVEVGTALFSFPVQDTCARLQSTGRGQRRKRERAEQRGAYREIDRGDEKRREEGEDEPRSVWVVKVISQLIAADRAIHTRD